MINGLVYSFPVCAGKSLLDPSTLLWIQNRLQVVGCWAAPGMGGGAEVQNKPYALQTKGLQRFPCLQISTFPGLY